MAIDLEELWQSASDEKLVKARENFDSIREETREVVLAQLQTRGLQVDLWKCLSYSRQNPGRATRCRGCGSEEAGNEPRIECPRGRLDRAVKCVICRKETAPLRGLPEPECFAYCPSCARKEIKKVLITTTPSFVGYRVKRYPDIQSAEVVTGTGLMSGLTGSLAVFFGARSTAFGRKLHHAKKSCSG